MPALSAQAFIISRYQYTIESLYQLLTLAIFLVIFFFAPPILFPRGPGKPKKSTHTYKTFALRNPYAYARARQYLRAPARRRAHGRVRVGARACGCVRVYRACAWAHCGALMFAWAGVGLVLLLVVVLVVVLVVLLVLLVLLVVALVALVVALLAVVVLLVLLVVALVALVVALLAVVVLVVLLLVVLLVVLLVLLLVLLVVALLAVVVVLVAVALVVLLLAVVHDRQASDGSGRPATEAAGRQQQGGGGPAAGGGGGAGSGAILYRAHYKALALSFFFACVNFPQFTPACFVQFSNLHAGVLTNYTPECML